MRVTCAAAGRGSPADQATRNVSVAIRALPSGPKRPRAAPFADGSAPPLRDSTHDGSNPSAWFGSGAIVAATAVGGGAVAAVGVTVTAVVVTATVVAGATVVATSGPVVAGTVVAGTGGVGVGPI